MNFIQKRIQERKLQEEARKKEIFKKGCCYSMLHLESYMENVKQCLNDFSLNKKNVSLEEIDNFVSNLTQVSIHYNTFLQRLKYYQHQYKTYGLYREHLDYMTQKKKEYRNAFERLYINFGRVSKGYNFPRRNEILGLMRKAFDFDSSKYYAHDQLQ